MKANYIEGGLEFQGFSATDFSRIIELCELNGAAYTISFTSNPKMAVMQMSHHHALEELMERRGLIYFEDTINERVEELKKDIFQYVGARICVDDGTMDESEILVAEQKLFDNLFDLLCTTGEIRDGLVDIDILIDTFNEKYGE